MRRRLQSPLFLLFQVQVDRRIQNTLQILCFSETIPVSILHNSIAGRYRPVRVADGPITVRCRFIKNTSWDTIIYISVGEIELLCKGFLACFVVRGVSRLFLACFRRYRSLHIVYEIHKKSLIFQNIFFDDSKPIRTVTLQNTSK